LPKPNYPGNDEGIVVVQVTVNKAGQVTKAEAGVKGSNTADPDMIAAARKAALQARFNADENAPAFQVGTITYRFVLD
jgi:TonB family protein